MSDAAPRKTRADLELDAVLAALASSCKSEAGRRKAAALPFLSSREAVLASLGEIDEATRLADRGAALPAEPLPEVSEALSRARVGAALSLEEVRALSLVLNAARRLRRFLKAHKEEAPRLAVACDSDPSLDALTDELDRSFEPDGTLSDAASPRLAELRSERKSSRDRLIRRLEELVAKYASLLSDSYWTERDGRYVLPVRSDSHERFPGIVHGASAGGSTLFVEPRVVVSMGNRQKVLEAAVQREEELVVARLSASIAQAVLAVEIAVDALAHADLRAASAELAVRLKLRAPEVPPRSGQAPVRIELVRARHPILVLDGVDVVASDLALASGEVLIMSGPNAGGKTVALKTLGLAALMIRLGLPVTAAEGSVVGFFDAVLTDVGDEQSLAKNLSTFSAHVRNLVDILEGTSNGVLVLLDEVASGTDPREGEALATSLLESLSKRGGAVACTTHYEGLKLLALSDPRFINASVGFDLATLTPTFKVLRGVPGASSALAVARRFGVPGPIIERAEGFLSKETRDVAKLVADLERERLELEKDRTRLEREGRELAEKQRRLDEELAKATARDERDATRESEGLIAAIKRAREELRSAEGRLRARELDARALAEAEKAIDRVARNVAIGGPLEPSPKRSSAEGPPPSASDLFPGAKVFVPRLRTDADVLEVLASGQIRVAAGPLKLLVSPDEVRRSTKGKGSGGGSKPVKPSYKSASFDAASDPELPIQTSENTVDLRGLRAHEAIASAEQHLDRCIATGLRVAFLIHGHGTGALRLALRDALNGSGYVERMRPGEPREGGDGVTVVWLR